MATNTKNFINIRIQAHNNLKIYNSFKHNLRHTQKSLSSKEDSKNNNYLFLDNKTIEITNKNKKELYNRISKDYQEDRKKHNELYKANFKRNLREVKSTYCEGVFTFSEGLKVDLKNKKYTLNDLSKVALECLDDFAKQYKTKINYMVLHLDEKTPHFQFSFSNYDEKGFSISHKNREKEQLSQLQDLAFKHFGKLGMERGIKKEFTQNRHKSAKDYWNEKSLELKNIHDKLVNTIKTKEEQKKDLDLEIEEKIKTLSNLDNEIETKKNSITILNEEISNLEEIKINVDNEIKALKEERKELVENIDIDKETKKTLHDDISKEQQALRDLRKDVVQEQLTMKQMKQKIINDAKNIIDNSQNNLMIINRKDLKTNIENMLVKYSNIEFVNTTLKNFKEENDNLKEENKDLTKKLDNTNDLLNDVIYERNTLRKEKEDTNQNTNNVLNQFKVSTSQKELGKDKILNQTTKMLSKANMKLETMNNVLKDNGIKLNKENVAKAKGIETTKQKKLREQEYKYSRNDR